MEAILKEIRHLKKFALDFTGKTCMGDDIRTFVEMCDICQRTNDAKLVKTDTRSSADLKINIFSMYLLMILFVFIRQALI